MRDVPDDLQIPDGYEPYYRETVMGSDGFARIPGGWATRPQAGERSGAGTKPKKRFNRKAASAIMDMEFEPLRWAIEGYVAEGLSVLAGRQKLGKTWLALDWAIAVATGGIAMNSVPVEQGDVLYIDMENGHRRIQRRVDTLFPSLRERPDLSRLEFVTEAPLLNEGFIDELEKWRRSVPMPKLVVIDVLQRVKPAGTAARNAYENDYSIMADLQQWATLYGIAVVALHHTRKGGADDPLEALSGSNGLSACADATLVLDRDANGTSLYVRGRDVEEKDTAIRFDGGWWTVLGDAADVRRSDERSKILAALDASDEPMKPGEVADTIGRPSNNVRQIMFKMAKAGEIERAAYGRYATIGKSHNTRHTDNTSEEAPAKAGIPDSETVTASVIPITVRAKPKPSAARVSEPTVTAVIGVTGGIEENEGDNDDA